MNKRTIGQLVATAYVLHGAAESFAKPEVSGWKLRRQADRVMKHCLNAIGSVGAAVIIDKGQYREVSNATKRQAQRTLDEFVGAAGLHFERRQFYCSEFVAARVMSCHYAIDAAIHRNGLGKKWRMLEQVTATMLGMLLEDMGEAEALMFRVAETFEGRCAA